MDILVSIHGLVRWVLAILAIVVLVKYAIGWLGKRPFTAVDKQLGSAYAGTMTVQFVLGIVNIIGYVIAGRFSPGLHIEHAFYGLIALSLSHMLPMFKNQPDDKRFRNAFFLVLLSLIVVFWSVIRLRGGWGNMVFAPF